MDVLGDYLKENFEVSARYYQLLDGPNVYEDWKHTDFAGTQSRATVKSSKPFVKEQIIEQAKQRANERNKQALRPDTGPEDLVIDDGELEASMSTESAKPNDSDRIEPMIQKAPVDSGDEREARRMNSDSPAALPGIHVENKFTIGGSKLGLAIGTANGLGPVSTTDDSALVKADLGASDSKGLAKGGTRINSDSNHRNAKFFFVIVSLVVIPAVLGIALAFFQKSQESAFEFDMAQPKSDAGASQTQGNGLGDLGESPIEVLEFDVMVISRGADELYPPFPIFDASFPLSTGDAIQFRAKSTSPAFYYLIWIYPNGTISPVWPWNPPEFGQDFSQSPSLEFAYPSGLTHLELDANEKKMHGIHSVLLISNGTAIESFDDTVQLLRDLPKKPGLPIILEEFVVKIHNEKIVFSPYRGGPFSGNTTTSNNPIAALLELIRSRLLGRFDDVRVVSFAVGERE